MAWYYNNQEAINSTQKRVRVDISCFDVTESLILIHPSVDIGLTKFTSGLTSLSGVALRFSGEMLREFSKLPKKKKL